MEDRIKTVSFTKDQITHLTQASFTPLLVTPQSLGIAASKESLMQYFSENKTAIREYFNHSGALIFRGFELNSPQHLQESLSQLDFDLYHQAMGGNAPRSLISDKVFISTEVPKPFMLAFHNEFAYLKERPEMIAFFCEKAPEKYGETPIFDCSKMVSALPDTLINKLATLGVCYHRKLLGKRNRFINFRRCWQDIYYTNKREDVEKRLAADGIEYTWKEDGSLSTRTILPAFIKDATTDTMMLNVNMFNAESYLYGIKLFKERYSVFMRRFIHWFAHRQFKPGSHFLYITFGDGTPFSTEENRLIQHAAWRNAIVFKWRVGDLMLLNNKRWAHGRLNVYKQRKIFVAMGDPYHIDSC